MKLFFSSLVITCLLQGSAATNAFKTKDEKAKMMRAKIRDERKLHLRHHDVPHQWQPRIVGGQDASEGEYPFFVQADGCGASLISKDMVLTAAHCQDYIANSNNQVLVGSHEWDQTGPYTQWVGVEQEIPHPQYDGDVYKDYMVVKLSSPVTNTNIQTIGLAGDSTSLNVGDDLTVIGYGSLSEGGNSPDELQEVVVQYQSTATCNSVYGGSFDSSVMFCAGVQGGGKDSCQGDSGGPIFKNGYQVGIVSWGDGCARNGVPGVYSLVSAEIEWIKQTVCLNSNDPPTWACAGGTSPVPPGSIGGGTNPTTQPPPPVTTTTQAPPVTTNPPPPVTTTTQAPPVTTNPPPPSGGSTEYVLSIEYDFWPEDIEVTLVHVQSGTTIVNFPDYTTYEPYAYEFQQVNLVPGEQYQLTVTDNQGDGMPDDDCYDWWIDTYVAVDMYEGDEWVDELALIDGCEFYSYATVTFTVPDMSRSSYGHQAAAQKKTRQIKRNKANFCANTQNTFLVKGTEKDCHWLQANWPRTKDFCSGDVARACPSTCGACPK